MNTIKVPDPLSHVVDLVLFAVRCRIQLLCRMVVCAGPKCCGRNESLLGVRLGDVSEAVAEAVLA